MLVSAASAGQRSRVEATEGTIAADAKVNGPAVSSEKLHGSERQNERKPEHNLPPRRVCLLKEYRLRQNGSMRDYTGRLGDLLDIAIALSNSPLVQLCRSCITVNRRKYKSKGALVGPAHLA
jgi:hypothetical protein